MDSVVSPKFFVNEILTKLFNNELEPTIDNINYVCNFTSSINYGLLELTDEQIDFWITLLSYTRKFISQCSRDILLFNFPSIIELVFITIQIEQICSKRNKKIPNLIQILEGKIDIKNPERIIELPIVPILQYDGILTDAIKWFEAFKPLHKFELPTLDTIIHYAIIMSLIYCDQIHQPELESFSEFKKRAKYVFKFPDDFVYDISSMPPIDDPFSFLLIRSYFEDLNSVHLNRPFKQKNAFLDVVKILLTSKEEIDETKYFSTFVYIESQAESFPMEFCNSKFSRILFLATCEIDFSSEITFEKGKEFHLTPNFLMVNKMSSFFSRSLCFNSLIDTHMKFLFANAKFVIRSLDLTSIEILTNESKQHSLSERLHELGSLVIEELKEDDYPTVFSFWCSCASNLISELKTVKVTSEHINGLIGVCRVAAAFSKKYEFTAINCILNQDQKGEYKGEIPSTFPSYPYTTPSDDLALCDSVNINFESIEDVLRYLMLIAMIDYQVKPNEFLLKLNDDYYREDKHELKDPLLFIALRFLYEKTFNRVIKRPFGNTTVCIDVLKNENVNPLAFYQGTQFPTLVRQTFEKRELFFALWASGAFNKKDLMSLCSTIARNGFQLTSYVISHLNTELDNLVIRSSYDDIEAAKELLKHKECLPFLNEKKSMYHLLLKIFLSDEEPIFNPEVDLDDSDEISAKLFVCTKIKKVPPTDYLITIVKKCYFYIFEDAISSGSEKNYYLFISGIEKDNQIQIFEKEEEFFRKMNGLDVDNSINFINTVLYYTLYFLKDQNHPELIQYYSDFSNHGLISPKIREILPKPCEKRSIYWLLCTCTLPYNRSNDLDFILEEMDVKLAKQLYQYILLNRDVHSLVQMLQNKRVCSKAIETIGKEYLSQTLELFFDTNSQVEINKIAKILIDEDRSFIIDFICTHIIEYPDNSIILFKNLKIEQKDAIDFISKLPKIEKPIPTAAIPFFEAILHPLSRTLLRSQILKQETEKDESRIKLQWKEDAVEEKEGSIDIWKEKQYLQCEGNDDNKIHCAFYCHSCSMSDSYICAACAATCHKGHRVSFFKKYKFKCSCQSCGTCIFGNQHLNQNDQVEKLVYPPTNKLVDLMIAISNIKEGEEESELNKTQLSLSSRNITSRLTKQFSTSCNYNLNCIPSRYCFAEKKKRLIDINLIKEQYKGRNQQFYKKRCSYVPLNLSDYINGKIIFGCGKSILLIDEITYEIESTISLAEEVMSVKVSDVNNEMIVLTALRSVTICKSSNLSKIFTIYPSNLDENNLVIQAEIPIKDKVCVVRRQCVELYQIGNNNPIETFTVNNDFITSSVFVNYHDRPFGIFALNNGRIALQVLGEGESGLFNHFSSLPSRFVSIFISYCKEKELFFIAALGTSLQYTPLENVFKYDAYNTNQLRSDSSLRNEICFHSVYPGVPSILIFINPTTNTPFAIEFTDDGVDISSIAIGNMNENGNYNESNNNVNVFGSLSIFDSKFNCLSVFRTSTNIMSFSSDGSLLQMEKCAETNTYEYRAPPSFYTSCEIATTDNAEIIGTDTTQNYNTLFHDSVAFFHVSVKRKVMTLLLKDSSYSIVGFVLSFEGHGSSHRPLYISVFGRRYSCIRDYSVSVPLLPTEVNPGKPLDIEFVNNTSEIAMQGIKIFIIKSDKILPFLKTIKRTSNENREMQKNLLDFQDDFHESKSSIVENLMYKTATAINFENDDGDKSSIVELNSFALLIRLMYTNRKLERFARSAVVRIILSNKNMESDLLKIWAEELVSLLNEKLIDDKLWEFVWRDYILLPDQAKKIIKEVIWSSNAKIGSAESIFSVFTDK